jgi:hypothetical protein
MSWSDGEFHFSPEKSSKSTHQNNSTKIHIHIYRMYEDGVYSRNEN